MSLSKKALKEQYDITSLSGSEYEPFSDGTEDSDTPPSPVPKRQRTIPKKLKEYLTPDAESPKQESLKGKAMSLLGFDGKSSVLKAVIN